MDWSHPHSMLDAPNCEDDWNDTDDNSYPAKNEVRVDNYDFLCKFYQMWVKQHSISEQAFKDKDNVWNRQLKKKPEKRGLHVKESRMVFTQYWLLFSGPSFVSRTILANRQPTTIGLKRWCEVGGKRKLSMYSVNNPRTRHWSSYGALIHNSNSSWSSWTYQFM